MVMQSWILLIPFLAKYICMQMYSKHALVTLVTTTSACIGHTNGEVWVCDCGCYFVVPIGQYGKHIASNRGGCYTQDKRLSQWKNDCHADAASTCTCSERLTNVSGRVHKGDAMRLHVLTEQYQQTSLYMWSKCERRRISSVGKWFGHQARVQVMWVAHTDSC